MDEEVLPSLNNRDGKTFAYRLYFASTNFAAHCLIRQSECHPLRQHKAVKELAYTYQP